MPSRALSPHRKHPLTQLEALRLLGPNWDGEPCDPPKVEVIDRARHVVEALVLLLGEDNVDVDADVLGGVAIYADSLCGSVWISYKNDGHVVVTDRKRSRG